MLTRRLLLDIGEGGPRSVVVIVRVTVVVVQVALRRSPVLCLLLLLSSQAVQVVPGRRHRVVVWRAIHRTVEASLLLMDPRHNSVLTG